MDNSPGSHLPPNARGPHSWVEVDRVRLRENIRQMRQALRSGAELMLVVKADAYGHGAVETVRTAAEEGVRRFAVAHLHEALEIRPTAPEAEILLLGPVGPDEVETAIQHRLTVSIVDTLQGRQLASVARALDARLRAHLKIDTGMGRLGWHWQQAAAQAAPLIGDAGLSIEGLFTHFARVADESDPSAEQQMERFRVVTEALERVAGRRLFRHASNTRAFLFRPDWDFDAVRPGIGLYGYETGHPRGRFHTRPPLQWKARVVQVRDVSAGFPVGYDSTYTTPAPTRLAVLSVGYADGYPRALSNSGTVLLGGRRCRVVGRVSMSWISVDAGPDNPVQVGDEAVLIGRQGDAEIWADELAAAAGTIPYEIVTRISPQVPRIWR